MYHKNAALGDIHKAVNWVVADEAARLALSVSVDDLYKICWQIDTAAAYILTDESPVTWKSMGGNAGEGAAFYARPSVNQAIPASTATKINLDIEDYDTDGQFAASRFTCVTPGIHSFKARIAATATNGLFCVPIIRKNGADWISGNATRTNADAWVVAADFGLVAADYVELFVYSQNAFTVDSSVHDKTMLCGHFVRSL